MSRLWFACDVPERPPDSFICWHYSGCRACSLKAAVVSHHQYPEDGTVQRILGPIAKASQS